MNRNFSAAGRVSRVRLSFFSSLTALALLSGTAWGQDGKLTRVGVVLDGKSEFYTNLAKEFGKETRALVDGEFVLQVDEENIIVCDFSKECVDKGLDKLLADENIDLVVGQGLLASNEILSRKKLSKPALAPFVIDPRAQGLEPTKARKNLGYILWSADLGADLRTLEALAPFKKAVMLVGEENWKALPDSLNDYLVESAKKVGKTLTIVSVGESAKSALEKIPAGTEAVYVGPLLTMPKAERKLLAKGLEKKKLPSFTWAGEAGVKEGFLLGTRSMKDSVRLARRFALHAQALLLGEAPEPTNTRSVDEPRAYLNAPVAQALRLAPDMQSLISTTLIGAAPETLKGGSGAKNSASLTLRQALEWAIKENVTLRAADQGVEAKDEARRQARSPLLPQIQASLRGQVIDQDRAVLFGGSSMAAWRADAQQSIYDPKSWGGLNVSSAQLRAQKESRQSAKLDVVFEVASAYISLLQAATIRRIQEEDLSLSRDNLDMARIRQRVGQAGMEEVYRWESRIAQSRVSLLEATARMASSRVQLNTLLNRPAETPIVPEELSVDSAGLLSSYPTFVRHLENPREFHKLLGFMVHEGLLRAPELKGLVAQMDAAKSQATMEKRSYFLPSVGIDGYFEQRFAQGGQPDSGTTVPSFDFDSFFWQVGVSAKLPLFEGLRRDAAIGEANANHGQLSFQKKETALNIERQVRETLYYANASYASIEITKGAEKAAAGNLRIVTDQYQRGRAQIIQLLDAQNEAIVAQNQAANAEFGFLLDLIRVERAAGRLDLIVNIDEQEKLVERLAQWSLTRKERSPKTQRSPEK